MIAASGAEGKSLRSMLATVVLCVAVATPATASPTVVDCNATGFAAVLHPVHRASGATDRRAAEQASYNAASGRFTVPARTAVVFIVE
jgi:hypothetical protein